MPETALILAPRGRDAALVQTMLAEAGIASEVTASVAALVDCLAGEAGLAVLTEEAIRTADTAPLHRWIKNQPAWSDFPFILLTEGGRAGHNPAGARYLDLLGNVTFIERPFHPISFVALARAALRGRR